MNEFKGTPGPWEVDGTEIYPVAGHRATDAICGMAVGFSHADAALIAAAPELLQALIRLAEAARDMHGYLEGAVSQAEDAIAGALGH